MTRSGHRDPAAPPASLDQGDRAGGLAALLEALIFNRRRPLLAVFLLVTLALGYQAARLQPDASFEKMIPLGHPYVQAFMRHAEDLGAAGTSIRVAVEHVDGDIFDAAYLDALRRINDEVFYLPGVDRNRLRSLWTPNVRWTEVTEQGFEGDKVIDASYDGSAAAMEHLRLNILRSGELGRLVADNYGSSIIEAPLFDRDPRSGEPLDYWALSHALEERVRDQYQDEDIRIHIVGFAKMIGDLLDGVTAIAAFAVITLLITSALLAAYSHSISCTIAPLLCSGVAVVWQLGLLRSLGYGLNAYSILMPFLIFAIGVSHGVQVINAVAIELAPTASPTAASRLQAARRAFRTIYLPGMTALISDAFGFTTMMLIDIAVIRELGVAASVGVAAIILTNLVLLPIIMSYVGISARGLQRLCGTRPWEERLWRRLAGFASRRTAPLSIAVALAGFAVGAIGDRHLQIGDLDPGAPELRPDSRYNRDGQFVADHYTISPDALVVMVETATEQCSRYDNMATVDRFTWAMTNTPGVDSAVAATTVVKLVAMGYNEGNLKWATIPRDQRALDETFGMIPRELVNHDCSLLPVALFLSDHKAQTLQGVVEAVEGFAAANDRPDLRFVLAAGNAGIEAATNQEIDKARLHMLLLIYAAVCVLIWLGFRSWRAVVCITVPLMLTSSLCHALMASLGIGVKVATLPVIALGVGVGVDYGIYIYSRLERFLRGGMPLQQAYCATLGTTGKAVAFTAVALSIGVTTWIASPIKFQADMGKLLTFMFLWNMLGALWLLPALASYLLKPEPHRPGTPTLGTSAGTAREEG